MTVQAPLLEMKNLVRDYALPRRRLFGPLPRVRAVDGVSLTLAGGESFGLVGESGCGKSTLARLAMALDRPTAGEVRFRGRDLFELPPAELRSLRRDFQMVFQDPYGSLDPRHKVGRIVGEPLQRLAAGVTRQSQQDQVAESLASVGLKAGDADKYPHEFSGGQRQRIAIARALITRPALIVADEPVSALDVSVQAQVLNLMMDLQKTYALSYLFIGHDLAVVRHVTDHVAIMYQGRIVEQGRSAAVFNAPAHPYTQALLQAVPRPDPQARRRQKAAKSASDTEIPVQGCKFAPRCPMATDRCRTEAPLLQPLEQDRQTACHHAMADGDPG